MLETRPAALTLPKAQSVALPRATSVRLNFLEGLRALAALWVVFSHAWINQCGVASHPGVLGLATNWLLYSHLAVDVFIVLSGFCLAWSIRREGHLPKGGVWAFWQRRVRRLLPPCYLSLALAIGIALVLGRLSSGVWHLNGQALAVNLFLVQDLFLDKNVYNGPLWSIAVEWRLSLVFPLLVWLWGRGGPKTLLSTTLLVGAGLTALLFWYAPQFWLSCPWYLFLFALGMCAALAQSAQKWNLVGWVALAALVVQLFTFPVTSQGGKVFGWHMPEIDLAAGLLTAACLVNLRQQERIASLEVRFLSWQPLVRLGNFSYSLYLTHVPLLLVLGWLMRHNAAFAKQPHVMLALFSAAMVPLLISLAYLFYLVCERPFIVKRPSPQAISTIIPSMTAE